MSIKICLDAGHYYGTAGKRTPVFTKGEYKGTQIREAEQNYPVMEFVGEYLKYNGFDVVYTNRDIKYDMSLPDRTTYANNENADLFISIHKNAFTGEWQTKAKGIETFYYSESDNGKKLAKVVQNNLKKDTDMKNRGVKTNSTWQVLKNTRMPAIVVELGFMDYYNEAMQMKNVKWQMKFAKAITKGVCEYAGVEYKEEAKTKTYFRVIAGSFAVRENAEKRVDELKKAGFDSFIDTYNFK